MIRGSKPQLCLQQCDAVPGKERGYARKQSFVGQIETLFWGVKSSLWANNIQSNLRLSRNDDLERIQQNVRSFVWVNAANIQKPFFFSAAV